MKTRILIIEDDKAMRENTAEILELAHYDVITAENGKIGSLLAKSKKPNLILSDIMMPGLDGYGVLHVLSKDPTTACIPFIFLTAKAEKSEWRKGMELGADDYIIKPFEDTELLNAVETRMKKCELLKNEFTQDIDGLNDFLAKAKGIQELSDLSYSRAVSKYRKKEVIFHSGDEPHYLFFLNKGKVKTYKTHDDGKEYITSIYNTGDFFGYPPLLEDELYSDSALVIEDSEIYKIPKVDFLSLMYRNNDVASKFIKMLSNQISYKEKQLLRLAYDSVRKRTAEALLEQYKQNQIKSIGQFVSVSRDDLAGLAGTATETAIRCLSEFKDDKFVEIQGRNIVILDFEGLKAIQ